MESGLGAQSTSPYPWRDRLVLLAAWVAMLLSAAYFWAASTYVDPDIYGNPALLPIDHVPGGSGITAAVSWALLLGLAALPLFGLTAFRLRPTRQALDRAIHVFLNPATYCLLLIGFELAQIRLLQKPDLPDAASALALVCALSLIAVWLVLRRSHIDLELTLATVTWAIALGIARGSYHEASARINIVAASWPARLYVLATIASFGLLLALPLALIFPRTRAWAREGLHWCSRIPLGVYPLAYLLVLGVQIAYQLGGPSRQVAFMLLGRMASFVFTLAIGCLALRLTNSSADTTSAPSDLSRGVFAALVLAIGIACLILAARIGSNQLYALNPDSYSYLLIARKYAEGQVVVRGYWSPLISWLLALLLVVRTQPEVALRVIGGIAGGAWILLAVVLARRQGLSRMAQVALLLSLCVIALTVSFESATPDLLGAVFVAVVFLLVTDPGFLGRPLLFGALAGLAGALAYYGKYYNLPFVLGFIPLVGLLYLANRQPPRAVLAAVFACLAVLVAAVAPWIVAMSLRYGRFTITTSSAINRSLTGPGSVGHTCGPNQLCEMPADTLIPGEDPQPNWYVAIGWSPFDSPDSLRRQIRVINENIWNWGANVTFNLGALPLLSLVLLSAAMMLSWHHPDRRLRYGMALLGVSVYVAGYMLTYSYDFRYFLAIVPLFVIAAFLLLDQAARRLLPRGDRRHPIVSVLVAAMVLLGPIPGLVRYSHLEELLTRPSDPCLRDGALAIAPELSGPIAGTARRVNWIAYYDEVRSLDFVDPDTPAGTVDSLLRSMGVRTFIVPAGSGLAGSLIEQHAYRVVTQTAICGQDVLLLRVPGM
jgi:hypothetical protein